MATKTCWKCCGCEILVDDFTRADSGSDPGANWEVIDGTWGISGNALHCSTGTGLIITTKENANDCWLYVGHDNGDPGFDTNGDTVRLIVDYIDEDNYLFCEFVRGPGGNTDCTARLWERVAGVEGPLADALAIGKSNSFQVCIEPDFLTGYADGNKATSVQLAGRLGGTKVGIQVVSGGPFESLEVRWRRNTNDPLNEGGFAGDCKICSRHFRCDDVGFNILDSIDVTFAGLPGSASGTYAVAIEEATLLVGTPLDGGNNEVLRYYQALGAIGCFDSVTNNYIEIEVVDLSLTHQRMTVELGLESDSSVASYLYTFQQDYLYRDIPCTSFDDEDIPLVDAEDLFIDENCGALGTPTCKLNV